MRFAGAALAGALLVGGCGGSNDETAPANSVVVNISTTANSATVNSSPVAADPGLAAYEGKYPFDKVDGIAFLEQPAVKAAVEAATGDTAVRGFVLSGKGPQSPIVVRDGKLIAWGCEQHNCGAHNWTLMVAPDGTSGELCVVDEKVGTRWYAGGKPTGSTADCPTTG